ncbi:MAG: phosphotriesterase-related protein [Sulfobacillus acidophilus]|uniref:Phosphotriesterase-related protein n=1 Tax=Sulfobacillus acidophilus TaxID=53633 RepID=A0A2T2WNT5_9FIRM|nr:MAG: phosphotriesterase-related protein [Sulfobacillus acidophilus]
MSKVCTVTGLVPPTALGITLSHEHTFLDLHCWWQMPRNPDRDWLVEQKVSPELYDVLRADPYHCRDNLCLDDMDAVTEELLLFRELQGSTVVDLSSSGIGPYPEKLRELSRRTGLYIVAGTGFYVQRAHPPWIGQADVEEVAEYMLKELTEGFNETDVRAGIIGEIGTSSPVHPDELKVLQAAAKVQRQCSVGLNVHLAIFATEGLTVLQTLESCGADLSRVVLSHLDENLDPAYHRALADRGVFLEFDTFGSECAFQEDKVREPTDAERLTAFIRLVEAGYLKQLLISQDVCTKMQWHQYGGHGYDHVLRSIVPQLRCLGLSDRDIRQVLVLNPAFLLSGEHID